MDTMLNQAKDNVAMENYSLPFSFLTDAQKFTLLDLVALEYARLQNKELFKILKTI